MESSEDDILQCGKCKLVFTDVDKFVTHKQSLCYNNNNIYNDNIKLDTTNDGYESQIDDTDTTDIIKDCIYSIIDNIERCNDSHRNNEYACNLVENNRIMDDNLAVRKLIFINSSIDNNTTNYPKTQLSSKINIKSKKSLMSKENKGKVKKTKIKTNVTQTQEKNGDDNDGSKSIYYQQAKERFEYECKYCKFQTKFKLHIIEHMLQEHKIYLMECPEGTCKRQFKDEWKLKRHLESNRDHGPLNSYKDFLDVMQQHVSINMHKQGFPCPLCTNMYMSTYDAFLEHMKSQHESYDLKDYAICKHCGQVVRSNYKLKCHIFNVHSGKRKNQTNKTTKIKQKTTTTTTTTTTTVVVNDDPPNKNSKITNTKENNKTSLVLNTNANFQTNNNVTASNFHLLNILNESNYCNICEKSFQTRLDLQLHTHHSRPQNNNNNNNNTNDSKKDVNCLYTCNQCNKKLKDSKQFQRHMQTQHGTNESGEPLIECPVCERTFSAMDQLERHMHMHETWVLETSIGNQSMDQDKEQSDDINDCLNSENNDDTEETDHAKRRKTEDKTSEFDDTIDSWLSNANLHSSLDNNKEVKDSSSIDLNNNVLTSYLSTDYDNFKDNHLEYAKPLAEAAVSKSCVKANSTNNKSIPDYRDIYSVLYCHECEECKIYYKSNKLLAKHKREVHKLKPVFKCMLVQCGQEFDKITTFIEHSKIHSQKNICCLRCKKTFASKSELRQHMKNLHYAKPAVVVEYNCNHCKLKFKTENELENHQKEINHTYRCHTCQKEFQTPNSLHNHLATHNDVRLFECELCKCAFKTRKDLSRHQSSHDEGLHKTCKLCFMTFKTSFHLKRHELTRHTDIKPFKCEKCDMKFARKDKLKQHQAKHIENPIFKCSQCSKGFYRKEHLKDHEISKHSKQYPFSCEHCEKGFVHAKDLYRHIRVRHLGLTSFKTNSESDEFDLSMLQNEKLLNGNNFIANNNNNVATENDITKENAYNQQEHLNESSTSKNRQQFDDSDKIITSFQPPLEQTHHDSELKEEQQTTSKKCDKSFKCPHCNRGFYYENHLKKHIVSKHTDTPLYSCSHCKEGFTTRSTAKSHVDKSHTKYECSVCVKQFRVKSHAQRHTQTVHGQDIEPKRVETVHAEIIELSTQNQDMINLSKKRGQTSTKKLSTSAKGSHTSSLSISMPIVQMLPTTNNSLIDTTLSQQISNKTSDSSNNSTAIRHLLTIVDNSTNNNNNNNQSSLMQSVHVPSIQHQQQQQHHQTHQSISQSHQYQPQQQQQKQNTLPSLHHPHTSNNHNTNANNSSDILQHLNNATPQLQSTALMNQMSVNYNISFPKQFTINNNNTKQINTNNNNNGTSTNQNHANIMNNMNQHNQQQQLIINNNNNSNNNASRNTNDPSNNTFSQMNNQLIQNVWHQNSQTYDFVYQQNQINSQINNETAGSHNLHQHMNHSTNHQQQQQQNQNELNQNQQQQQQAIPHFSQVPIHITSNIHINQVPLFDTTVENLGFQMIPAISNRNDSLYFQSNYQQPQQQQQQQQAPQNR